MWPACAAAGQRRFARPLFSKGILAGEACAAKEIRKRCHPAARGLGS